MPPDYADLGFTPAPHADLGFTPKKAPAVDPAQTGLANTAADNLAHGALMGASHKVYGLGKAIGNKVANLLGVEDHPESFGDLYNQNRDARRLLLKAQKKEHPIVATGADIVGSTVPALLPGVGAAAKGAQGAAGLGATLGGLRGVGEAENLNVNDIGKDAALGALLGRAGYEVGRAASPLAQMLREKAIEQGRKVLMAGKQSLTRGRVGVSDDAVREALDAGLIRTGSTSKAALERGVPELEAAGERLGDVKKGLSDLGVQSFKPADEAIQMGAAASGLPLQTTSPRADMMRQVARDIGVEAVDPVTRRLPISRGEAIRQELDQIAKSEFDKLRHVQSVRGQTAEDLANRIRAATEAGVQQSTLERLAQAQTPAERMALVQAAEQFVPAKQQYGRLAEAVNALREGVGQAQRRSGPSLSDAIYTGAQMARHGPLGALMKPLAASWRARGPSTLSAGSDALANLTEQAGPWAASRGGLLAGERSDDIRALVEALRRKKEEGQ